MASMIFTFVHLFGSCFLSSSFYYNSANPNMTGDSHDSNREENDMHQPALYADQLMFLFIIFLLIGNAATTADNLVSVNSETPWSPVTSTSRYPFP